MQSPEGQGGTKRVIPASVVQITIGMHPHNHPKAEVRQNEFCWLGLGLDISIHPHAVKGSGRGGGGGQERGREGGGLKPSWLAGLGSCGLNCDDVTLGLRRDTQVKCVTGVLMIVFVLFVCFVSHPCITVTVDWVLHTNVCMCVCDNTLWSCNNSFALKHAINQTCEIHNIFNGA